MIIRPYEVKSTPEYRLIKVDARAYAAKAVIKYNSEKTQPKQGHIIACNTNFFWKGTPIGLVYAKGLLADDAIITQIPQKASVRPCLVIGVDGKAEILSMDTVREAIKQKLVQAAFQAGPLLVRNGAQVNIAEEMKNEAFLSDVNRKCAHAAAGVTKEGKLLIAYFSNASLATVAKTMIAQKAVTAMNLDGGHSAWLLFKPMEGDESKPFNLGNTGLVTVGMELTLK